MTPLVRGEKIGLTHSYFGGQDNQLVSNQGVSDMHEILLIMPQQRLHI